MIDPRDLFLPDRPLRDGHEELFQGRRELLQEVLGTMCTPGASMVLAGDLGVGKTSLAWQVMRVLTGNPKILNHLKVRLSFTIAPARCVWLQCNRSMRDLDDVLIALMTVRTLGPCLRSDFPDAFRTLEDRLADVARRNLEPASRRGAEGRETTTDWGLEVRRLFYELLDKVRKIYRTPEIVIFLDDLLRPT
jgi:hypothetical protein